MGFAGLRERRRLNQQSGTDGTGKREKSGNDHNQAKTADKCFMDSQLQRLLLWRIARIGKNRPCHLRSLSINLGQDRITQLKRSKALIQLLIEDSYCDNTQQGDSQQPGGA